MRTLLVSLVRCYQFFISPWLGKNCRFYPSCSNYAKEAIERYGVFRGIIFTAKRLFKCHPFCEGGYDPVPEQNDRPEV